MSLVPEVFVLGVVAIVQFALIWTLYRRLVATRRQLRDARRRSGPPAGEPDREATDA